MQTFSFTARSSAGKTVKGQRTASSDGALAVELAKGGLFLIRASPAAPARVPRGKFSSRDLAPFLLHLTAYLEAGLPLLDALEDYRDPSRPAMEAAAGNMGRRLAGGARFSDVAEAFPGLFQPVHVAMLRAGETAGRMAEALRAMLRLVEWNDALRAQVRQATTYPLVLLALMGIMVPLICAVTLPSILNLMEGLQVPLPLVTKVFIHLGKGMRHYGWLLPVLVLGVRFAMKEALKRPAFRLAWDTALLELPVAGPLVTRIALARFTQFLGAQHRAGIPLVRALETCETVTGNACLGQVVRQMREGVEQGGRMADCAAKSGRFPPLVLRMLAIGEETGTLEETLARAATYLDKEVAESVRLFFQVLDPTLKVVMGCGLVFVASAVLLPLYLLIGSING